MSYRTYAHWSADESTSGQREAPGKFLRATDADARVGDDPSLRSRGEKAMARIGADIHFMMAFRDFEGLREFARAGTKLTRVVHSAALFHQRQTATRFESANQNQSAAFAAFHEKVKHPVDAVIHIDVNRARDIALDEGPRARPRKGVASLVVQTEIRLGLHDDAGAFSPDEMSTDEFPRADQRITLEKRSGKNGNYRHGSLNCR